jgi:hypothetical protein
MRHLVAVLFLDLSTATAVAGTGLMGAIIDLPHEGKQVIFAVLAGRGRACDPRGVRNI